MDFIEKYSGIGFLMNNKNFIGFFEKLEIQDRFVEDLDELVRLSKNSNTKTENLVIKEFNKPKNVKLLCGFIKVLLLNMKIVENNIENIEYFLFEVVQVNNIKFEICYDVVVEYSESHVEILFRWMETEKITVCNYHDTLRTCKSYEFTKRLLEFYLKKNTFQSVLKNFINHDGICNFMLLEIMLSEIYKEKNCVYDYLFKFDGGNICQIEILFDRISKSYCDRVNEDLVKCLTFILSKYKDFIKTNKLKSFLVKLNLWYENPYSLEIFTVIVLELTNRNCDVESCKIDKISISEFLSNKNLLEFLKIISNKKSNI